MAIEREFASMLVDVDTLLDTRASTLLKIDPKGFEDVLGLGYHGRLSDTFLPIGQEKFRQTYLNRDASLLKGSIATPAIGFVQRFVKQTVTAAMTSPYVRRPRVDINIYPYVLTEEQGNQLVEAIGTRLDGHSDVRVVNYNTQQLTPALVKRDYVQLMLYHWVDWLVDPTHKDELAKGALRAITLIGPALLKDEQAVETLQTENPFATAEAYYSAVIKLKLVPASMFSFDTAWLKKKAAHT